MHIIGITGFAGSGKSTLADLIKMECNKQQRNCIIYSISSTIKVAFSAATGMSIADIEIKKRSHPLVRYYLQVTGDWMNRYGQPLSEKLREYLDAISMNDRMDIIIIPDVRYPAEAKVIHDHKGHMVKINRPGFTGINDHPTEKEVDNIIVDYTVRNDKNMKALDTDAKLILDMFAKQ